MNNRISRSQTVANSPQARKRARLNEERRKHNAGQRSEARTYIKKVEKPDQGGQLRGRKGSIPEG